MKAKLITLCSVLFHAASILTSHGQATGFTYQGSLTDGGSPANGIYDLRFEIYDAASGGTQQGSLLTNSATAVSNGLFTVLLDFGNRFPGADRWLEIGVRTAGGSTFSVLSPRQPITSTPYAVQALSATSYAGPIADGQLSANIARLNGSNVFSGPVQFSNPNDTYNGSFTGTGTGLTNINIPLLTSGALSWGTFVLAASPAVSAQPAAAAAADLNGDGKLDLITANFGANSLSVLTNSGGGGFVLAATFGVGAVPVSITTADVNGDGKLDLICANQTDATLSILTNNGSGGFVIASSPHVGALPQSVVAADVNGDGKVDLICANFGENDLYVLTNNGVGGFVLSSILSVPGVNPNPIFVTAADLNGDGKVDLVCANLNASTISIFLNNGSGGFVLSSSPSVGGRPTSVAAADLNGDGKLDLVTANFGTGSGNTLSVLINNGSGGFTLVSSPMVGLGARSVATADVNGDGKIDLICANYGAGTLSVLTNGGTGGFALAATLATGGGPQSVLAIDVTGDGRPDLITANFNSSTVSVFFNTFLINGTFTGNGAGLTNLSAANFSGSIDALLSTNVALRAGGNSFHGTQGLATNDILEFGQGIPKELNAGKIGYQAFSPDSLDIVGAGTNAPSRKIKLFAEGGTALTGPLQMGSSSGSTLMNSDAGPGNQQLWVVEGSRASASSNNVVVRLTPYNLANVGYVDAYSTDLTQPKALVFNPNGGNVGIGTLNPTYTLQAVGSGGVNFTSGSGGANQSVTWTPGSGGWSFTSDRNTKERLSNVDGLAILNKLSQVPVLEWSYIGYRQRHLGPMAQDFHAAFPLNPSTTTLNDADLHGVALAAIQGLNQKVENQREALDARNLRLEAVNAALRQRLEALEKIVHEQKSN